MSKYYKEFCGKGKTYNELFDAKRNRRMRCLFGARFKDHSLSQLS